MILIYKFVQIDFEFAALWVLFDQTDPRLKDKHSVRPKLICGEIAFILPGYIGKMV